MQKSSYYGICICTLCGHVEAIPDCLVFFLCLSAWHIEEAFGSWLLGSPIS